jgi:hypothetical protein
MISLMPGIWVRKRTPMTVAVAGSNETIRAVLYPRI